MDIELLNRSNPWWSSGNVPNDLKLKERRNYNLLVKSVNVDEITILTGVRRSGKSTLMYQMIDNLITMGISPNQILFVNLEDTSIIDTNLDEIYQTYRSKLNPNKKAYIFLDEVHIKDGWERWIKTQYDLHSNCKFVISGSCSYLLKKEYSTLLTGRNITFNVFPLSFQEFLFFKDIELDSKKLAAGVIAESDRYKIINVLDEYLSYGGFPAIFFKDTLFKTKILSQYFDDILYKDIIDRFSLNSQKTRDLAIYLMTTFTSFISQRTLRTSLGLSYDSIKEYLSCFKEAFLFFTADHFSYSMKEQKTQPSKIYSIDCGLRNAVSFKFSKDEGKLSENTVFIELMRNENDVYYWRSNEEREVDFVIKNGDNSLTAINVSYTDDIDAREILSLNAFKNEFNKTAKLIIITKNTEKNENGITFIPLWKWLLTNRQL